jgi:predicted transcriptional regulator
MRNRKQRRMALRTSTLAAEGAAFRRAWKRAEKGLPPEEPRRHLSFADIPAMMKALTPKRWTLLETLRREGVMSIAALARRLGRDYKNVHADVTALIGFGLVERSLAGVGVPFDLIQAELRLVA